MSFTIAVSGKGGTGKTTICGLLIKYLADKFKTPVLAIDADPNMNLNDVLGLEVTHTIGSIREKTRNEDDTLPSGMSKIEYLDLMINQSLIEGPNIDLLVMGRPEGPGCYCAANHLIRRTIDNLTDKYKYIVIDNEAGMEHLSRHTTENIDLLLMISDTSIRALQASIRIKGLVQELKYDIKNQFFISNRVKNDLSVEYKKEIEKSNLPLLGLIPEDEVVNQYDTEGKPLIGLPADSKIVSSLYALLDKISFVAN